MSRYEWRYYNTLEGTKYLPQKPDYLTTRKRRIFDTVNNCFIGYEMPWNGKKEEHSFVMTSELKKYGMNK